MEPIFRSAVEIRDGLLRSLNEENILDAARTLLGPDYLKPSTVAMRKQRALSTNKTGTSERGLPAAMIEGAALAMLLMERENQGRSEFDRLIQEFRHDVKRTRLWAESAWHVFFVRLPKKGYERCDCVIWRFWEKMRTIDRVKAFFTHSTLVEGPPARVEPLGSPDPLDLTTTAPDSSRDSDVRNNSRYNPESAEQHKSPVLPIAGQWEVRGSPLSFGYMIDATQAIQKSQTKDRAYEFLGGFNAIPVLRSHILACIPSQLTGDPFVIALSLASQAASTMQYIQHLIDRKDWGGIWNSTSKIRKFLSPWGRPYRMIEKGVDRFPSLDIPKPLSKSISSYWPSVLNEETSDESTRVFLATTDFPSPLTYQTAIFRLREPDYVS